MLSTDEGGITLPIQYQRVHDGLQRYDSAQGVLAKLLEQFGTVEVQVILKSFADTIATAMELNKQQAILAMTEKRETVFGAFVSEKRIAAEWEYDDYRLNEMEGNAESIRAKIKERKLLLQHLEAELVDPATGEIIKPAKKMTDGGTTISITLPD
jgi:HD-like signal output (HDOD) protein